MKQTTDTCLNSSLNINEQYHHASVIVGLWVDTRKTRESKSCEKKKTGNVRLVTKRDCWELISQNKDTRKKRKWYGSVLFNETRQSISFLVNCYGNPGAPNENIVQNHSNIALLNVFQSFQYLNGRYRHIFIP